MAAATVAVCRALVVVWQTAALRFRLIRQPEAGQRHSGEADAGFLQRRAAGDRLSHALG